MNAMRKCQFVVPFLLLMFTLPLCGQQNQKTGPSASNQATAATLQGLSYERRDWEYQLGAPPEGTNYSLLCYTLADVNSGSQPFILRPVNGIYKSDNATATINMEKQAKAQPSRLSRSVAKSWTTIILSRWTRNWSSQSTLARSTAPDSVC